MEKTASVEGCEMLLKDVEKGRTMNAYKRTLGEDLFCKLMFKSESNIAVIAPHPGFSSLHPDL